MKKISFLILIVIIIISLFITFACKHVSIGIIGGSDGPTEIYITNNMTYEQQNENLFSFLCEKSLRRKPKYYISPVKQDSCGTHQSEHSSDNIN